MITTLLVGTLACCMSLPYFVRRMKPVPFFQYLLSLKFAKNPYKTGIAVALGNAVIFGSVFVLIFLIAFMMIGPFMPLIAFTGVVVSLWYWVQVGISWNGALRDRWVMALTASVFYWLLLVISVYKSLTWTPRYEGDDSFMATLGFTVGMIVSTTAAICNIGTIVMCRKGRDSTRG